MAMGTFWMFSTFFCAVTTRVSSVVSLRASAVLVAVSLAVCWATVPEVVADCRAATSCPFPCGPPGLSFFAAASRAACAGSLIRIAPEGLTV